MSSMNKRLIFLKDFKGINALTFKFLWILLWYKCCSASFFFQFSLVEGHLWPKNLNFKSIDVLFINNSMFTITSIKKEIHKKRIWS